MRSFSAGLAFLAISIAMPCLARAAAPDAATLAAADQLFEKGDFAQAGAGYARIAAAAPDSYPAVVKLGQIALLSNRLTDAKTWLKKAIALRPANPDPKVMLAEADYRSNDFAAAASALDGVDANSNTLLQQQYPTLNVAKLRSFQGQTPYEVQGKGQITRVPFLRTDPLPLVSVRVNGGRAVTFFIDTGGSEIALDTAFAQELGVPVYGTAQGTFSGGQHAPVQHGRIDTLSLGGWTVRNLPVVMLSLRPLSAGLGARQIDGIIGTSFLYHFLATMDYPHGALILRRKNAANLKHLTAALAKAGQTPVTVPFWIAGDHFMVGWGRIESLPPTLLFVDTGLAGAGVKLAEPVIQRAGIKLDESRAETGAGGGGTLKIVPYQVRRLSFGRATETNVAGIYDGPFPWENTYGFHLAGMVGHGFFKPYAVTFDFADMKIILSR